MSPADWLELLRLHLTLSPLAIGGAMTLAPELHRALVVQHAWLSEAQFQACLTLAQATPGPNVLYIALAGWTVGLQATPGPLLQQALLGALGLMIALVGVLLPSSLLACAASHWLRQHPQHRGVRAFRQGMAPVVVGVMLSAAWLLARSLDLCADPSQPVPAAIAVVSALAVWRSRMNLLWLIGAGGLIGAFGAFGGLGGL